MYKELRKMANFFFLRIASIAAFAVIVLIFFITMLLNRIRKMCCFSYGKKNKDGKKRAGNGMVIGEEELGEIEKDVMPVPQNSDPEDKDR